MNKIICQQDVDAGLEALVAEHPNLEPIAVATGQLPLRLREPGFAGLCEIIVSQQVSTASAAAIFSRLVALVNPLDAKTLLALGPTPMIKAGLSRAKQASLVDLAHSITLNGLDLDHLCGIPANEAMAQLTKVRGIGPWTAEVFLLFCAGHPDIFPAGDVALQHALGETFNLPTKPDEKTVRKMAGKWSPWRGIAARLFWARYAQLRSRSNAMPL